MSLKSALTNNLGQKLFSLGLATLVWFAVHVTVPDEPQFPGLATPFTQQTRGDYQLPITILNSANNTRAFNLSQNMADVVVNGDANRIKQLDPSTIRVFVDVSQVTTQSMVAIEVDPPANITFKEVYPTEIEVIPLTVSTNSAPSD